MDDRLLPVTLVIVTAFSVNTLYRLYSASKEYPTSVAFEDATHIPLVYAKYGLVLMTILLMFSLYLLWSTLDL